MPERIQLRRTAGWRMPAGAIYVGRRLDQPYHADVLLELANR